MKLRLKTFVLITFAWLIFSVICAFVLLFHSIFYREIFFIFVSIIFLFCLLAIVVSLVKPQLRERMKDLEKENILLKKEITECKLAERELILHKEHLQRLAHYDALTSLPNRVYFNEVLNKSLNHAKRHHQQLAILIANIDHFKDVNDQYRHHSGDLVLKELSRRFSAIIRSDDAVARLGGDEFIFLLHNIDNPKYVGPVAEKLLHVSSQPIIIESTKISVSVSIGIAIFPNDGESLEDLLKHADIAMYKSKTSGGNGYQYFRQDMGTAAKEHMKLEQALREALQKNEFVLHYQPQLSLENGSIKAVEALIRWEHPEMGLLNPDKFIPIAEETGLIIPIGAWVVNEACRTNKIWQKEGYDPVIVAVNLSAKQLRHPELLQTISDALEESHLEPNYLELEITETAVMDNLDLAIEKLTSINKLGVRIAIDDFGTGYTSISYLRQFPLNILKIDQTFIKGIPYNQNDTAITSAVISLGHNLGLDVVAEGVESTEQIQYLAEHNCDLIQGYFLSRPLPANKVIFQFTRKGKGENEGSEL